MIKIRKSISSKITTAFFIVVILSVLITGISFGIMIRNYIISQTRNNLVGEGKSIAKVLGTIKNVKDIDNEILIKTRRLNILSKNINVNFAVIDNDNNIIYSKNNTSNFDIKIIDKSIIDQVKKTKQPETKLGNRAKDFIIAAIPIDDNKYNVRAVLLLYTPVKGLNLVTLSIFKILIISILISVIIVFIVAYIFAINISKPISLLKIKTEKISRRNFNIGKVINTGDEIEDLEDSFNKMAVTIKEYDESQKKLLQNISHELKTPLMSIQGYAEGIKDGIIKEQDCDKSLNIIINESQRLKKLVDEIILLTKLESMDEIYDFEKVCINNVVKDAIDKIKSLVLKKDVEIKINEQEEINCFVDRDKISQVIINIVGNGIRYANKLVSISIVKETKNLRIEIENDGSKLTVEEKTNIFERFYKGVSGGQTGLGMAIANAIVIKHKGSIDVEDSNLGGPKFIIVIPC